MNDLSFDAAARALATTSRRTVVRGVAGGALAALLAPLGRAAAQAAAACGKPGTACSHGPQCCSGVCRRKKCRAAPHQSTCTVRKNVCIEGYPAAACNGPGGCQCFLTTGGIVTSCATGADCATKGQPAGTACVRYGGEMCGGGTACIQPCPVPVT